MQSLLDEREKTHGQFWVSARKAQQLKYVIRVGRNWHDMPDEQCEALDMIAVKIARILTGNHDEIDHWRDIAGYANLVVRELERLNPCTASAHDPTPRPGASNPPAPPPDPLSCVWPLTPEEEAKDF